MKSKRIGNMFAFLAKCLVLCSVSITVNAQLDESCIINVLNRTIQVSADGGWSLPNVPANQGNIRARVTCTDPNTGDTLVGQTDFFQISQNGITRVGEFQFNDSSTTPESLDFASTDPVLLTDLGNTFQSTLTARYSDGSSEDVTSVSSGSNYTLTNSNVVSISASGELTAVGNGTALLIARLDGSIASRAFIVAADGDLDGDGIPDDYETANGLNPNDPIDAMEDQDKDGLSALQEFLQGTNPNVADTDGDGINDGEELIAGEDGFISNPLLFDTDGDGLSDGLEVAVNSDPNDANDTNLADALVSMRSNPVLMAITRNTIDNETSAPVIITGTLIDGSELDITQFDQTNYVSSNLSVISFGLTKGLFFAGNSGVATVTANVGATDVSVNVVVTEFDPIALSSVSIPGYANNVAVQGDYAYIAAGASGLQVVDVSDRASPAVVSGLDTPGTAIDIRLMGNLAFIADGASGLRIIDITDPLAPISMGTVDTDGIAEDLMVQGSYVYIADGNNGLVIVDATVPAAPQIVGNVSGIGIARGVDLSGNYAVLAAGSALHMIDVSDKTSPVTVGNVTLGQVKDLVVRDNFAHVAAYTSGYQVVDISNPIDPVAVASSTLFVPRDVELTGDLALYAEQLFPNVIAYVNIVDPTNAVFQGTINLAPLGDFAGTGIALDEQYAYVTEESFVVSQDFKASGNTRLFIAQYRALSDTGTVAPTVTITSPSDGQIFIEGQAALIAANAVDDVFVAAVDFLVNDEVQFTDTSSPFEYTEVAIPGVHTIGARAIDLAGNIGVATPVTITVVPDETPPSLQLLSPSEGDSFIEGEIITISASATDDIAVSRVEFMVDDNLVATDTELPYEFDYIAASLGNVTISAIGYDPANNASDQASADIFITEDPKTTVVGTVTDIDDLAVENAMVTCSGQSATTDDLGEFSVANVPTLNDNVACSASFITAEEKTLFGSSSPAVVVRAGITDVGVIVVSGDVIYEGINFSTINQLYCNGTCSWAGSQDCDQADADIFCKLKTGNPNSVAVEFGVTTALSERGFACPGHGVRNTINLGPLPQFGVTVDVWYTDDSIRSTHGAGSVVVEPVCEDAPIDLADDLNQ